MPVVGRAPELLAAAVVDAAADVGLTDAGVVVGPVSGAVVAGVVGLVVGVVVGEPSWWAPTGSRWPSSRTERRSAPGRRRCP